MRTCIARIVVVGCLVGSAAAEDVHEETLMPMQLAEATTKPEAPRRLKKRKKKKFRRFITACLQFLEKEIGKAVEKEAVHLLEQAPKLLGHNKNTQKHRVFWLLTQYDEYRTLLRAVFPPNKQHKVSLEKYPALHHYLSCSTCYDQNWFLHHIFVQEERAGHFVLEVVRALVDMHRAK